MSCLGLVSVHDALADQLDETRKRRRKTSRSPAASRGEKSGNCSLIFSFLKTNFCKMYRYSSSDKYSNYIRASLVQPTLLRSCVSSVPLALECSHESLPSSVRFLISISASSLGFIDFPDGLYFVRVFLASCRRFHLERLVVSDQVYSRYF